ncbi:MAG: putative 2-dehydropantoate 2-reductase [Planctomycetota bacterium]
MSGRRRYAVVGAGALGGYYGGLLARAGFDVHFLLRSDFAHVREHGLRVDSIDGDFTVDDVHAHESPETVPPCDVVIVALKTTANAALSTLLPPLTPDGVVLVLQNGLDPEADSAAVVGAERVLGGCCFLCANKVGPGHIRHVDYGAIKFGEHSRRGVTPRISAIADDMRAAGIDAEPIEDLPLARWKKLIWNVPFNGLSVVLEASTDAILAEPATARLVEEIMAEVVAAAAGNGCPIGPDFVAELLDYSRKMTPYDSSMRVDDKLGRSLEIDVMYDRVVAAATAAGVPVPRIAMLAAQLAFREKSRSQDS